MQFFFLMRIYSKNNFDCEITDVLINSEAMLSAI